MGTKEHNFSQLPPGISLEDLVPENRFYRRLESGRQVSQPLAKVPSPCGPRVPTVGRPPRCSEHQL
jgi:hypothetical protein